MIIISNAQRDQVVRYLNVLCGILNDKDYTGGFLVLLTSPFNPEDHYDHWAGDARELKTFMAQHDWVIDWDADIASSH